MPFAALHFTSFAAGAGDRQRAIFRFLGAGAMAAQDRYAGCSRPHWQASPVSMRQVMSPADIEAEIWLSESPRASHGDDEATDTHTTMPTVAIHDAALRCTSRPNTAGHHALRMTAWSLLRLPASQEDAGATRQRTRKEEAACHGRRVAC